jgi:hypothetical protein
MSLFYTKGELAWNNLIHAYINSPNLSLTLLSSLSTNQIHTFWKSSLIPNSNNKSTSPQKWHTTTALPATNATIHAPNPPKHAAAPPTQLETATRQEVPTSTTKETNTGMKASPMRKRCGEHIRALCQRRAESLLKVKAQILRITGMDIIGMNPLVPLLTKKRHRERIHGRNHLHLPIHLEEASPQERTRRQEQKEEMSLSHILSEKTKSLGGEVPCHPSPHGKNLQKEEVHHSPLPPIHSSFPPAPAHPQELEEKAPFSRLEDPLSRTAPCPPSPNDAQSPSLLAPLSSRAISHASLERGSSIS